MMKLNVLALTFALLTFACAHSNTKRAPASTGAVTLIAGERYVQTVMGLLDHVNPSVDDGIDVLHYNFASETGQIRQIAEKLKAVKAQFPALPIRVMLEGEKDLDKPNGIAKRNRLTGEFFKNTGIQMVYIAGATAGEKRGFTHAKVLRVGNRVLAGSVNLTNTSVGKNNEFDALVESAPIAQGFKSFFAELAADSSQLHTHETTDGLVTLLTDNAFFERALATVNLAQKGEALDVTTYFFAYRSDQDVELKQLFDALVAAQARGALVRVLLEQNSSPNVNPDITEANRKVTEKFIASGVGRVYLDREEKISHFKLIRYSGKTSKRLLLGSSNLYHGDFVENHQVNLQLDIPQAIDALGNYLNQKFAYEVKPRTPPMHRFWRGYADPSVDAAAFRANVNARLIPETTVVGAGRGLMAYLPAFPSPVAGLALPDEVALVFYESEESYQAIRSTPKGAKYGPLHFEPGFFTKETGSGLKSTSTVLTPFSGAISPQPGEAVGISLAADTTDWRMGATVLRVLTPSTGSDMNALATAWVTELQATLGPVIKGASIVVDPTMILAYLNTKNEADGKAALKAFAMKPVDKAFKTEQTIWLKPQNATAPSQLSTGEGASIQFDKNRLSDAELIEPLLNFERVAF